MEFLLLSLGVMIVWMPENVVYSLFLIVFRGIGGYYIVKKSFGQ